MKGLLWNDLYNIGHNAKRMILILVIWAACFYGQISSGGYIIMCAFITAAMAVTNCAFDEKSNWQKYALTMPCTRKDYVLEKYLITLIYSMTGIVWGVLVTLIVTAIQKTFSVESLIAGIVMGLVISMLTGGVWILLVLKYGTEKSRLYMVGVGALVAIAVIAVTKAIKEFGFSITDSQGKYLLYLSPVAGIIMVGILLWASLRIYNRKEF